MECLESVNDTKPQKQPTIVVIICPAIESYLILKWKNTFKMASSIWGERNAHPLILGALSILEGQELLSSCSMPLTAKRQTSLNDISPLCFMQHISGLKLLNFPGSFLCHILLWVRNSRDWKPGPCPPNNSLPLDSNSARRTGIWSICPLTLRQHFYSDVAVSWECKALLFLTHSRIYYTTCTKRTGDELAEQFSSPWTRLRTADTSWRSYTVTSRPRTAPQGPAGATEWPGSSPASQPRRAGGPACHRVSLSLFDCSLHRLPLTVHGIQ